MTCDQIGQLKINVKYKITNIVKRQITLNKFTPCLAVNKFKKL